MGVPSLGGEDPPGGGHGNPLQHSSPWGLKESDRTEQLTLNTSSDEIRLILNHCLPPFATTGKKVFSTLFSIV